MPLDESQERAVQLMLTARLALVTGPPGSGKTTTLRTAIERLDGESFVLCAPTGKAARRMAQATGHEARTIHRMLGFDGRAFQVNRFDPIEASAVFVDEASMIDYQLACALFEGTRQSRLVFVGDADQLPPVGMGRMFGDLIDGAHVTGLPVARLTTQHRAAEGSWVVRNAPLVLTGGPLEMDRQPGFEWVDVPEAADVPRAIERLCGSGAQVLAPQYDGPAGVDKINWALDAIMNPYGPPVDGEPVVNRGQQAQPLRRGMRVIQTANNYRLEVMNGEIGQVLDIERGGSVLVEFPELPGGIITYPRADADALKPAYALTVHKTQGSEFARVIVVCHSTHTRMLSRSILYTAITRAKTHVTIVGDRKGLSRALKTDQARRLTSLIERLAGTLDQIETEV